MTNTPIWDELIEQVRDQPVYGQLWLLYGSDLDVVVDRTVDLPDPGADDGGDLVAGEPTGE